MPEKTERDYEIEGLREFYSQLWRMAIDNPGGDFTRVNRQVYSVQNGTLQKSFPPIYVELSTQIERHNDDWGTLNERLFVTTESSPSKLQASLRGPTFQKSTLETVLTGSSPEEEEQATATSLVLRYSSVESIADLEPIDDNRYSPVPEEGRPQIKFRFTEIYHTSRDYITKLHSQLARSSAESLDVQVLARMRSSDSPLSTSLPIAEVLPIVESAPLSVIEAVTRVTFWDKDRSEVQPANVSGIRITQTLNGLLICERLAPWIRHDAWERLNVDEKTMGVVFESNRPLLEENLGYLANAVSQA